MAKAPCEHDGNGLKRKPRPSAKEGEAMAGFDEDRVFEILLRVRAGSANETDATRGEVRACIEAGLLEWTLPDGLRYTTAAVPHVSPGVALGLASPSKVHPVRLTMLGRERIQSRLGKGFLV